MKKLSAQELQRVNPEEFKQQEKFPVVVVLDNIRSALNIGSAFRSSDGFGIEKVVLTGICAKPPSRDIHKTALGAQDSVAWDYYSTTKLAIEALKDEGYVVLLLEQTDSSLLISDFKPLKNVKYAFVFGNEVMGVDEAALSIADGCVEIPQFGTKHSLNVSVTVGITLWHYIFHVTS